MNRIQQWFKHLPFKRRPGTKTQWRLVGEILLGLAGFGLVVASGILIWISTLPLPDIENFDERKVSESTKIYDRTGEVLLYDVHEYIRRTVVDSADISVHMKNAIVAIEDQHFYRHKGFEPAAFMRAVLVNIKAREFAQGGSTITQQVIKNALLTNEKTIPRKLKEIILALRLEQVLDKDQILTIYLNEAPFGGQIYGIEEAARSFFDKSAAELDIAESAYLAALPQAPTYYSPYGNNLEDLEDRKNTVLSRMFENGFISEEQYQSAKVEAVTWQRAEERGLRAPHFVMYVRGLLEKKYGREAVQEGGLRVITTLNYDLQKKAEELVKEYALKNEAQFNASNAAVVAVDPNTGQILTMVGSRDYFDETIDGNYNVALAERQPGSTFKPFVYATAFAEGYTPETVIYDLPTQFNVNCPASQLNSNDGCFAPENYDLQYRGPMTIRNALAQSVNVVAVKALYLAGVENAIETAHRMGISTLSDPKRYGLSLVLGAGEVKLLDLANAYGVFANDGIFNPTTPILKIQDRQGTIIEEYTEQENRALDRNVARMITDVLSDNQARTPAFGSNSPLYFPGRDVAAKTGTTNDYRDVWTIGYTPNVVVGAWAGNNDNSSMEKKVAGFIITPLWNAVMKEALKETDNADFSEPDFNYSGLKPILRGAWQEESSIHSILYFVDKNNPRGPYPANPSRDPQFANWESSVQGWLNGRSLTDFGVDSVGSSTGDEGGFRVLGLKEAYKDSERVTMSVSPEGATQIENVEAYLNGTKFADVGQPFQFSFTPAKIDGVTDTSTLKLRVIFSDGSGVEKNYTIQVTD